MIRVLLLIFDPVGTWERIVADKRRWPFVFAAYLLPLLLLVGIGEGYGLMHWGKPRGAASYIEHFSLRETLAYEGGQIVLSFLVVLICAKLVESLGETFHGRHNFSQAVTAVAYALGPIFLLRLLDAFPGVSPWVGWGIGIVLMIVILYHGLPRAMEPDPAHAFGLFLVSILLLMMVSGLARFLTAWYLQGKFTRLNELLSGSGF